MTNIHLITGPLGSSCFCFPPTNVAQVRFRPDIICGLGSLLFLALPRGFLCGYSGFRPSTKTNISKFQFDQDRGPVWRRPQADVASSLNFVINYINSSFNLCFNSWSLKHCLLRSRKLHIFPYTCSFKARVGKYCLLFYVMVKISNCKLNSF